VAPIGVGPRRDLHINADTVAGAVAGAIVAERLVLLTESKACSIPTASSFHI